MADPVSTSADPAEGEGLPAPKKKFGVKKILLFIVLPLLLLGGGAAGAYFAGLFGKHDEKQTEAEAAAKQAEADAKTAIYYNLPEILVNLQAERGRSVFLKLTISLELTKADDQAAVERVLPRVIDNFQIYLRELRVDDLRGSAGLYRLREELLMRVSQAVAPVVVRDVLFKEMLVQ